MEEIKAFILVIKRWALIMGSILLLCAIFYSLSSCSGSRHMVKSSSKTDSLSVVKTEVQKDSTVRDVKITNTQVEVQKNVKSTDDYEETITRYFGQDKNNIPTIQKEVITRKGTKTVQDSTKKKTNIDAKNDIKSHSSETKKEDNKTQVAKAESNKKVDSEHSILSRGSIITFGVISLIVIVIVLYFRKKLK